MILKRLRAGGYHDVIKWERDIRMILDNCRAYNGDLSFFTVMAARLIYDFEKLKRKFLVSTTVKTWATEYCALSKRLNGLLARHPRIALLPQLEVFDDLKTDETVEISASETPENLERELAKLTSRDQQLQLLFLLKRCEPEMCANKNEIEVSLSKLKPETIWELTQFVSQQVQVR
jgi:hypothetical protein